MPSPESRGSPIPFVSFRRSILSIRSEQVHSLESSIEISIQEQDLDSFQQQVYAQFNGLTVVSDEELLSISWIQKLLDAYCSCQEDFRTILLKNRAELSKSPLDRLASEFFERTVKALDICNAIREGIEKIRQWKKHLDIVLCALDPNQKMIGEGQFRRARKTLMDLALLMLDDKETGSVFSHRNRSFGRHHKGKDQHHRLTGHSRSLSWSVSHSWSASKQLHSIASSLVPPRGHEIVATRGLANFIYTMANVLMLVLWALVAAFPCQDRNVQIHFAIPRQFWWGAPMNALQSRILEENKKRERRNANGLLKDIHMLEKCVQHITDLVDSAHFPLTEELKEEVRAAVQELSSTSEVCKGGLDPVDRQLREVFHKIMNCRTEGLELLNRPSQA